MVIAISFSLLCLLSLLVAWIDLRQGIIPDGLNLAIAAIGLWQAVMIGGTPAALSATAQAVAIGATIWLLRRVYFSLRKIQGLGLGDVKLLAASGFWIGIAGLPLLLLVATMTALGGIGLMQFAGQRVSRQMSIPFGPFLAIGLLFAVVLRHHWL